MRFTIRLAGQGDLEAMAAVVKARANLDAWARRGRLGGGRRYADHVALPGWVIIDRYSAIAGFTCLYHVLAAEPCGNGTLHLTMSISQSCTRPRFAHHHPGALIARWAIDHAARGGLAWVRFNCTSHRLATYCRDTLDWTIVRRPRRRR